MQLTLVPCMYAKQNTARSGSEASAHTASANVNTTRRNSNRSWCSEPSGLAARGAAATREGKRQRAELAARLSQRWRLAGRSIAGPRPARRFFSQKCEELARTAFT